MVTKLGTHHYIAGICTPVMFGFDHEKKSEKPPIIADVICFAKMQTTLDHRYSQT
jgi:hypothetical protein